MSRRTNVCSMKHTPLCPAKSRVRLNWLRTLPKNKDLITISHGIFDEVQALHILNGWHGRIQACDIDQGVRTAIEYMLRSSKGGPGDYPTLNILPPGNDVFSTTVDYLCVYGTKKLGAVDLDTAETILGAWNIASPVIETLVECKVHCKVLLTFRNGRADGFGKNALPHRIQWLGKQLPRGAKIVRYETYNSGRIDENARRSKGAAMCVVEIQT